MVPLGDPDNWVQLPEPQCKPATPLYLQACSVGYADGMHGFATVCRSSGAGTICSMRSGCREPSRPRVQPVEVPAPPEDAYLPVYGDLRESLPKQFLAPQPDILREVQSALVSEQGYFPKCHGGYSQLLIAKRDIHHPPGKERQAEVTGPKPDKHIRHPSRRNPWIGNLHQWTFDDMGSGGRPCTARSAAA